MKIEKIVGSGALNIDYFYEVEDLGLIRGFTKGLTPGGEVWGTKREFETLREKLEILGRLLAVCGGGSAANTIYALKLWGFDTGFIGIVGDDEEGERVCAELEGCDLSRVLRPGSTACTRSLLDHHRDRAIFVAPHTQEETLASWSCSTQKTEWLHLSSLVSHGGFLFHLRLTKAHWGPRSIDPGEIYASRGFQALKPLLQGNKVLFMTLQELRRLDVSAEELILQNNYLALKKGAEGAEIHAPQGKVSIPAVSSPLLVDNTGAGDVFDAGFLAGLSLGLSYALSGRLAVRLAALSLRDYGRKGFPTKEEFWSLVESIRSET